VSFQDPIALAALAAVPVLGWLWLLYDRRRRAGARAFTNLALLPNLVDSAPGRLRLVPPALLLAALAALVVGFARPHANVTVQRHEATVVLALDLSRSMQAHDVSPTRMIAAKRAAAEFLQRVPDTYSVAVVGFASRAYVAVPPTRDRLLVEQALAALTPGDGTAIGDAVALSARLGQRQKSVDGVIPPESVLVISDGAPDGGRVPAATAVKQAKALHVPVSTVLIGTSHGVVTRRLTGGYTAQIRVPPSPGTLRLIAKGTGGEFFRARSASALDAVYKHLATRIGHRRESREITDVFALGGLVLLLAGAVFSMLEFRRVA
jgi:Ca-activated chloride channel family protein